jgi:dipeptidyl aminopeptidase/acylaminoacyl peptidase
MKPIFPLIAFLAISVLSFAQRGLTYQTPPKAIADLADAPLTPLVSVNAAGEWMLLLERPGYPSIEELAQPELKLAGLRINPRTNGQSRSGSYNGLRLKNVQTGQEAPVAGLPDNPQVEHVNWSPDGKQIAFTITRPYGIELWVAGVDNKRAKKLTDAVLNAAMGGLPYAWLSNSRSLLARLIHEDRSEPTVRSLIPTGPVIQETDGGKAPVRTYQDLLKDLHDEVLFEYYCTSQLAIITTDNAELTPIGSPAIYSTVSPSPDGNYTLTGTINRPYSYIVPFYRFPVTYDIIALPSGEKVREIAAIPLSESIPKGFNAVREGPRNFTWRSDHSATLYWVEALDGGDPAREVELRDRLYFLEAPFKGEKKPDVAFKLRYSGVTWGSGGTAICYESWRSTRQVITSRFVPTKEDSKQVLFDRSSEDRYNNPGSFVTTANQYGEQVLLTARDKPILYLTGQGASPEGNRPFINEFNLKTKESRELWRSQAPYYELPVRILDIEKGLVITRRESTEEAPNYFLRDLQSGETKALTDFGHPYPSLKGIEKQVIEYKRADGVSLRGDLYLPKGFDPVSGQRLPVLMWAYPNEFKSADAAGQVQGSPHEFIRLSWGSPLHWVTQGYAVFDNLSMPIVGEGDQEPNDSFKKQLVANAEAAIDKLVDMGIADRERIAIGGHSYGAFMTANLLAHSDLFAAGIARSGAYNRTLTPFGFQSEERTYWEAPEVYNAMSPFMHADKINEPILLIHGEADNNSGTFPIQSERLYGAVKGHGGTARLVMLPHESHGYRARESVLHMLWEMDQWLERFVKKERRGR